MNLRTFARAWALILCAAFMTGAQTIQTTEVSGYVFDATGQPAANRALRIVKVTKNGAIISTAPVTIRTDAAGRVVFNVIRASTVWIEGDVVGFNVPGGVRLTIPDAATAALETLATVAAVPATGLTLKSNNSLLAGRFGTIDFSSDFTLTDSPTGEANVALAQSYATASALASHTASIATTLAPGHVKGGGNITISADGTLNAPPGVTDHGLLTGLSDDDHPQYQLRTEKNAANGYAGLDSGALLPDNRLPASIARDTEITSAINALSTVYAALSHTHMAADVTDFSAAVDARGVSANTASRIVSRDASGNFAAGAVTVTGLTNTGLTAGSIPFVSTGGLISQDNAALFWDATNDRLGVGTAIPLDPLHLEKNQNARTQLRITNPNTGASSSVGMRMTAGTDRGTFFYHDYTTNTFHFDTGDSVSSQLALWTRPSSGASAERLRIDSAGLVGIGTSSPSTLLHLSKATNPALKIGATGEPNLYLNPYTGALKKIKNITTNYWYNGSAFTYDDATFFGLDFRTTVDTTSAASSFEYLASDAVGSANLISLLKIQANGFVGIGVSPTLGKLHVDGGSSQPLYVTSTGLSTRVGINHASNTGFGLYIGGAVKWSNAVAQFGTGNQDYAIYNEQLTANAFYIDGDNNNVGIGTTTNTAAKLHILTPVATKGLVIQMSASPTANPFEVQNSTGTALNQITSTGAQFIGNGQTDAGTGAMLAVATGIYTPGFIWAGGGFKINANIYFGAGTNNALQVSGALQIANGGPQLGYTDGNTLRALQSNGTTLGDFNAASFKINGTKVLGTQCAAIANATDAATAITQLNATLACMRAHGLLAP